MPVPVVGRVLTPEHVPHHKGDSPAEASVHIPGNKTGVPLPAGSSALHVCSSLIAKAK